VDSHNSLGTSGGRSRSIAEGDPRLADLGKAIAALRRTLDADRCHPYEIGISERAVAASGARHCFAIVIRVHEQTSAVIVLEANNLPLGVREDVLAAIGPLGIESGEVATADAHLPDIPAVTRDDWKGSGRDAVIRAAREAVREAVADLRPARIRYGIERIPLRIWGPLFEKIVRTGAETVRLGMIAGAGLLLLYVLLASLGTGFLR
jgi:predicted neutral ceramidase superfamily lipid hydrolase